MTLNVRQFQIVANNINRADFNDRCQSMSNVSPDENTDRGEILIFSMVMFSWEVCDSER